MRGRCIQFRRKNVEFLDVRAGHGRRALWIVIGDGQRDHSTLAFFGYFGVFLQSLSC